MNRQTGSCQGAPGLLGRRTGAVALHQRYTGLLYGSVLKLVHTHLLPCCVTGSTCDDSWQEFQSNFILYRLLLTHRTHENPTSLITSSVIHSLKDRDIASSKCWNLFSSKRQATDPLWKSMFMNPTTIDWATGLECWCLIWRASNTTWKLEDDNVIGLVIDLSRAWFSMSVLCVYLYTV